MILISPFYTDIHYNGEIFSHQIIYDSYVVITDAIKFVQTNKEKLTMSTKEDNIGSKESRESDHYKDKEKIEEEYKIREQATTNHVF
jgi:hypothetical protein